MKDTNKIFETEKYFINEGTKLHHNGNLTSTGKYRKAVEEVFNNAQEGLLYDGKGKIIGLTMKISSQQHADNMAALSIDYMNTMTKSMPAKVRMNKTIELITTVTSEALEGDYSIAELDSEKLGINFKTKGDFAVHYSLLPLDNEAIALVGLTDSILDTLAEIVAPIKIGNFDISQEVAELIPNPEAGNLKASDFIYKDNKKSPAVETILTHLLLSGQVRLFGPPSTGKNVLAEDIAKILDVGVVNVACTSDMDATDFFYSTELVDGDTKHVPSELVHAFEHGGLVVVDEFNSAPADVLIALHSLLDDRKIIENKKLNNGKAIERHENCYFIFTMNEGLAGTKALNHALESRMPTVYIGRHSSIKDILKAPFTFNGKEYTPSADNVDLFNKLYRRISSKLDEGQFTEAHVSVRVFKASLRALTLNPNLGFKKAAANIANASVENPYAIEDIQGIITELNDKA